MAYSHQILFSNNPLIKVIFMSSYDSDYYLVFKKKNEINSVSVLLTAAEKSH